MKSFFLVGGSMLRVGRIAGAAVPLMMIGAWACGNGDRSFVNEHGNPVDAAPTPDIAPNDGVSNTDAKSDAGSDAVSLPDASGADATSDATADRNLPTDAAADRTSDAPAMPDGQSDAAPDVATDMTAGDVAIDGVVPDVYADATAEPDAAPPPCSPVGGYRCVDVDLQQCTETGWQNRLRCATPALCDATGGMCTTPVCQPNTYRCNGATLQICNQDQTGWLDKESCPSPALCDATGGKCGSSACMPGSYQCSGAVLQQCRMDQTGWDDISSCATSALCNAAGGVCNAPACAVGQFQCNGSALQQCNADRTGWTTVNTCATPGLCDAAGATCNTPACAANQHQCVGSTLQVCNTDQTGWATQQNCLSQLLCDAAGGVCKSGCTNMSPYATAYSSGGGTTVNKLGPEGMNDGILGCAPAGTGGWHWISNGTDPGGTAYVQLNWTVAQTIAMMHIDTANQATGCYYNGTQTIFTGRTFEGSVVQYWTGAAWQNIGSIAGQTNDFDYVFPGGPVTTIAIRLYDVYSYSTGNTPVLEWQTYAATGCLSPYDP